MTSLAVRHGREQCKEMLDHLALQRPHSAWRCEKANAEIIGGRVVQLPTAVVAITENSINHRPIYFTKKY